MAIEVKDLSFSYKNIEIFNNLNLNIKKGKVTVILGPSGCGKTTLLNLISGVLQQDSGSLKISENAIISYLFQDPRLLPWMNVEDNIKFVLNRIDKSEAQSRVNHYLKELELTSFSKYLPHKLSGGMRQRVALARALSYPSNLLLMDEPFKGLDLALKLQIFKLFNKIIEEEDRTVVFVTHDIHEAILLGDEVIFFSKNPVKIKRIIKNNTQYRDRNLSNAQILELEKELYQLIS